MSNALLLKPNGQQYLTPFLESQQLLQNTAELELATDIAADEAPYVALNGMCMAYLQGNVTIDTASVSANMPLASLPIYLTPKLDTWYPVTVLRGETAIDNHVKVESGGSGIDAIDITTAGVYETIPTLSLTGPGEGCTFTTRVSAVALTIQTAQSSTGSYAPGDTLTGTGGTATTQFVVPITHTQVVGTPAIGAAGTGGTPGSATVTGTTGTGTPFEATVTIGVGGDIESVDALTVPGSYTVNPTSLTAEPVTGGGLVGAQLNIKMGPLTLGAISTAGVYTAIPSDPITTTTSGSGTGCTLNAQWGLIDPVILTAGTGYTEDSALDVSAGDGAGALVLGDESNGLISLVTEPQQNDVVCLSSVSFIVEPY